LTFLQLVLIVLLTIFFNDWQSLRRSFKAKEQDANTEKKVCHVIPIQWWLVAWS
jgi:hypothetical protein